MIDASKHKACSSYLTERIGKVQGFSLTRAARSRREVRMVKMLKTERGERIELRTCLPERLEDLLLDFGEL